MKKIINNLLICGTIFAGIMVILFIFAVLLNLPLGGIYEFIFQCSVAVTCIFFTIAGVLYVVDELK